MNLVSWPAHFRSQLPGVSLRHPPVASILYLHDNHDFHLYLYSHDDHDYDYDNRDDHSATLKSPPIFAQIFAVKKAKIYAP